MSSIRNPLVYEINRVEVPKGVPLVHTDISFKDGIGSYAFLVKTEGGVFIESDSVPDEWLTEHSRSCELYAILRAVKYCSSKGYKQLGIFFDYIGVYNHQIYRPGDPENFKKYATAMKRYSSKIEMYFHKVNDADDIHSLVDLISKASVKLRLGGDEIGRYRKLVPKGKRAHRR